MKKQYVAPRVRMVDFQYDEQIVAASVQCNNYSLLSKANPNTCFEYYKDKPLARYVGCTYKDNE